MQTHLLSWLTLKSLRNAGIGYETALALASKRYATVLACRDMNKAAEARDRIRYVLPTCVWRWPDTKQARWPVGTSASTMFAKKDLLMASNFLKTLGPGPGM